MVATLSPQAAGITGPALEELLQECCSQQLVAVAKIGPFDDGDGPGAAAIAELMWLGLLLDELRTKLGPVISELQ